MILVYKSKGGKLRIKGNENEINVIIKREIGRENRSNRGEENKRRSEEGKETSLEGKTCTKCNTRM